MKRPWYSAPVLATIGAAAFLGAASRVETPASSPDPGALQFRVIVTLWNGFSRRSEWHVDTLHATAAPGEAIAAELLQEYRDFASSPPLTLERADTRDRAWVSLGGPIAPALTGFRNTPVSDSVNLVLISTTPRTFCTIGKTDGGIVLEVEIVPAAPSRSGSGPPPLQLISRKRDRFERDPLVWEIREFDAIGVFRLTRLAAGRDSTGDIRWRTGSVDLDFVAMDIWRGDIRTGEQVTAKLSHGFVRGDSWFAFPHWPPMRKGFQQILFLRRGTNRDWKLDLDGYALLDGTGALAFGGGGARVVPYGHRIPTRRLRREVTNRIWSLTHGNRARTCGTIYYGLADFRPAEGLKVSVGAGLPALSDSSGFFELYDLPIGVRELRVEGPCGAATTLVELSDEFADSLEVRVPFPAGPCGPGK